MKSILILSILLGLFNVSCAQFQTKMITDFNKSISYEVFDDESDQIFKGFGFALGARFENQWGSLQINTAYKASSSISLGTPKFQSHFLGGGIKYILLRKENKFRPFIEFNLFSEIATNYEDEFLSLYRFAPTDKPSETDYYGNYYSLFYDSTPLIGNLLVGMEAQLSKRIILKVALGYGKRKMLYRDASWNDGYYKYEDLVEELHSYSKSEKVSKMLEAQVGLTYSITFRE